MVLVVLGSGEKPADSVFINGGLSTTVEIDLKKIYIYMN
jgi:hypothetical protein